MWCKKMTEGYRDVDVRDMTSSWKNGLAFCALIHRFRPDLIDYDSLSKENVFENNQMAFDIAEKELSIPAFLDAPDMVAIRVPDRLSIVTYVSQYYNNLHDKPQLGGPGVKKAVATKRHQETVSAGPESKRLTISHDNVKTPTKERQVSMGDKCYICRDKVYLMERHVDKNKLYHRHCFRHSDLSPTNKVFNKSEIKKIKDKVKNENEANKQTKSENSEQSQPDFWKRRNEARKVVKMDTDDSISSKDSVNKGAKPHSSKDDISHDRNINSDKNRITETGSNKKDRPSDLNFGSKTEIKKSIDPKSSPRKHKVDHVEPMVTSEINNLELKPVPTPRHPKGEKETSPVNGFLSKNRDKTPDATSSQQQILISDRKDKTSDATSSHQKLSSSSDMSPLSPPALPSQPPPSQLLKSDLLSPRKESNSDVSVNKPKPTITQGRKSPTFNVKVKLASPRSTHTPDSGSSIITSPRNNKFSPTFSDTSTSSESSQFSVNTKDSKISPKTVKRISPVSNVSSSSNFVAQRSSAVTPPLPNKQQFSVTEAIDLTKKSSKSNETVAVVFTPSHKQQDDNDKQVRGGLLSNLANIRRQKRSETSPTEDIVNRRHTTGVVDNQTRDAKGHVKSAIVTKHLQDSDQNKVKHFTDHESHAKQTTKNKTDSDIPEWRQNLEKNRNARPKSVDILSEKNRNTRPKTVDILSDKNRNDKTAKKTGIFDAQIKPKTEEVKIPPRPKSVDLLSDKSNAEQKQPWQIEAENRMKARKGGYVDPEKARVSPVKEEPKCENDGGNAPIKPSRVDIKITNNKPESDDVQKKQLPAIPFDKPDVTQDKKRISVNVKFNFPSEIEQNKAGKLRPPRPPPVSPASPKFISPDKPTRPPPPLKDADIIRMSPFEIQKQLTEIDSRLTELEIRGRQLEDSIRKVQEEDEDRMMVEWFDLVNNKNELVRKEGDLIYLSRAQELEGEQHKIDRQLRALLQKDEKNKTEEEKVEEEHLMQKLLDVVNQRNIIVDSIDEDRIRYEEEDKDIAIALRSLTQDSGHVTIQSTEAVYSKKQKKKKGKLL